MAPGATLWMRASYLHGWAANGVRGAAAKGGLPAKGGRPNE